MKHHHFARRALCLLLSLVAVLALAACKKQEDEEIYVLEENELAVTWHAGRVHSGNGGEAGKIEAAEGYSYTDVITLPRKGTKVTFTDDNTKGADAAFAGKDTYIISHWVEKDGAWVLDAPGDHYAGYGSGRYEEIATMIKNGERVEYSYITSFANESIRICVRTGQQSEGEKGANVPRIYAERLKGDAAKQGTLLTTTSYAYKDYVLYKYAATTEKNYPALEGKTIYLMGDSLFDAEPNVDPDPYIWPNFVAEKYGMSLSNWGISGSSISAYSGIYTDGKLHENGTNAMCLRINKMADGAPDIVILEGGRNDLNLSAPIGTIWTDSTKTALSLDRTTLCGAINDCIRQLKEKYPNAMIIGMSCWDVPQARSRDGGVPQIDYAQAMLDCCAANGIPVLDSTKAPVHMDEEGFRTEYCRKSTDISHLNIDGMRLVAPYFEAALGEAYTAFLAEQVQ